MSKKEKIKDVSPIESIYSLERMEDLLTTLNRCREHRKTERFYKTLGIMEAICVMNGVHDLKKDPVYINIPIEVKGWFGKTTTVIEEESVEQYIQRKFQGLYDEVAAGTRIPK